MLPGCGQPKEAKHSIPENAGGPAADTSSYRLDCASFPGDLKVQDLVQRFGAANEVSVSISVGEGESAEGTVLFPKDPERKVEIIWDEAGMKRNPRTIKINGQTSKWTAPGGLALGQDLKRVQELNKGAFQLAGFGWDRGGSVTSWSGGALETSPCHLRARFAVDAALMKDPRTKHVMGDREFSSSDSTMRALNPRVVELWLAYSP